MLVHHSRNSVQKQWEETLVLALGGMARILRAHLPILIPIAGLLSGAARPAHELGFSQSAACLTSSLCSCVIHCSVESQCR